jgi:hypothetical protein
MYDQFVYYTYDTATGSEPSNGLIILDGLSSVRAVYKSLTSQGSFNQGWHSAGMYWFFKASF